MKTIYTLANYTCTCFIELTPVVERVSVFNAWLTCALPSFHAWESSKQNGGPEKERYPDVTECWNVKTYCTSVLQLCYVHRDNARCKAHAKGQFFQQYLQLAALFLTHLSGQLHKRER